MEHIKIIITIEMFHVLDFQNHHMYVMVVNLEADAGKKDILIMLEKQMILTKKSKVMLEKELI